MRAVVKSDFFDIQESLVRVTGDSVDLPDARIDEINKAYPGTLEKLEEKPKRRPAKKEG